MRNDYLFINSLLVWVAGLIGLAVSLSSVMGSITGLAVAMAWLYIGTVLIIGSAVIYQSRAFFTSELVAWVVINLAYILIGLWIFTAEFDFSDLLDSSDLAKL